MFFCATVGEKRTYLRFVPSDENWRPNTDKKIVKEMGTCLRLIEAEEKTETVLSQTAELLPPVSEEDIKLICWSAVTAK